jgi:sugar transferase (PEP-CTERM/EpsH1 system associated)
MSGILFLAHRVPFPPDRGDKIRSHHVLRALAKLAPVHVGCFAETAADHAAAADLADVAATWCMPTRTKPLPIAGIEAIVRGEAVSLTAFRHPELAAWVEHTLEHYPIDAIYAFSGQMGQYVPPGWGGHAVIDLVDVDSAKFEAYGRAKAFPMAWIDAREARLLRREEARLAVRAAQTLLVSDAEAALFASRLPAGTNASIGVLGNGIDAEAFDPRAVGPHPALAPRGPHFVFTGQMNYKPNVDAALRAIDRLMPAIRAVHHGAQFHAVGRAPAPGLLARDGVNGGHIWGEVPDVRPFLAAADVVLAPLAIARGVQNKVLEAMAMARPVLLTSAAATGLPGQDGVHFAIADSDEALAERALDLLARPESARAMGENARRLVTERASWPAMLAKLPEIMGHALRLKDRVDAA